MTEYERALAEFGIVKRPGGFGRGGYDGFSNIRRSLSDRRYSRDHWVEHFGFAIPNEEALELIASHGPILEVGAGTGYWAFELVRRGVDVVATDTHPLGAGKNVYGFEREWFPIRRMFAQLAVKHFTGRSLLISWPCYNESWPAATLWRYRGDRVFYVGEGDGGCTANNEFHEMLERDWALERVVHIPRWWTVNDRLYAYRRRGARSVRKLRSRATMGSG